MRMVSLKCPECGAGLNIEEGRTRCFCGHCGTQILLDDESKRIKYTFENANEAGYQFEQGRQRAQYESTINTSLANRIKELIGPLTELESLAPKLTAAQWSLSESKEAYEKGTSSLAKASPLLISGFLCVAFLLIAVAGDSFGLLLILLAVTIGIYFILNKAQKTKEVRLAEELESATFNLDDIQSRIKEIRQSYSFGIVAPEYQNTDALGYFYRALASGRAMNMNQAILQYEDSLKDDEAKRLQEKQIELQRQQLEVMRKGQLVAKQGRNNTSSKTETAAAVVGALYVGAKLLDQLNKRK